MTHTWEKVPSLSTWASLSSVIIGCINMITFDDGEGGFWQERQSFSGTISQKLTLIWDCSLLELLLFI